MPFELWYLGYPAPIRFIMWEKLKNILQTTKDKAIVIEDGEPRYVILSVDEYLRMSQLNNENSQEPQTIPNMEQAFSRDDTYAETAAQNFTIDLSDLDIENDTTLGNLPSDINLDDLPI